MTSNLPQQDCSCEDEHEKYAPSVKGITIIESWYQNWSGNTSRGKTSATGMATPTALRKHLWTYFYVTHEQSQVNYHFTKPFHKATYQKLINFKKGIKCNAVAFKTFKDDKYYMSFSKVLLQWQEPKAFQTSVTQIASSTKPIPLRNNFLRNNKTLSFVS